MTDDVDQEVSIEWVRVDGRYRLDVGDIDSLARSIEQVGLMNPITVTPDGRLVAGQRRLEALRRLGRTTVAARVVDNLDTAVARLTAERDENVERKEMTPEELVALGQALEELERPRARERQGVRRDLTSSSREEEVGPSSSGRATDQVVGRALGVGSSTYYRAKTVVNTSRDPEAPAELRQVASAALEDMNTTGNISGNYEKVRQAKAEHGTQRRQRLHARGTPLETAAQQRKALNNASHTLAGLAHGLALVDPVHPDITDQEAAQWIDGLSEARRVIESLIKRLRAHVQEG